MFYSIRCSTTTLLPSLLLLLLSMIIMVKIIDMVDSDTVGYNNNTNNNSIEYRVNGNDKVSIADAPWVVSIRNTEKNAELICGGVIVDKYWLLTTAQCIAGRSIQNMFVVSGSDKLHDIQHKHNIDKIVFPDLTDKNKLSDSKVKQLSDNIAMVKIKQAGFNFQNKNIQKIQPFLTKELSDSLDMTVYGWGSIGLTSRSTINETYHDRLTKLAIKIFSNDYCSVEQTNLYLYCLYSKTNGASRYDRGGPVVVQHNGQKLLAGIVSYTYYDTQKNAKKYTIVSSVRPWWIWIQKTIKTN
ncbi:mite allergen Der p 3-like [Oppia nitens]|uniref:mite allergen Der p 3-like n=1 Tax=Oppia nitens TaxID=1686743 RepID=UPI0023DBD20B|nr:mite allergen Der p 3-like [Oppia nitens]